MMKPVAQLGTPFKPSHPVRALPVNTDWLNRGVAPGLDYCAALRQHSSVTRYQDFNPLLLRSRGFGSEGRSCRNIYVAILAASFCAAVSHAAPPAQGGDARKTVLAAEGTRFTINGEPKFLLGFSYYAALGAREDFIRKDLNEFQRSGFNWLRVWANWSPFGHNIAALGDAGRAREPFLSKLKWLVAECDHRGLIVDITLTKGRTMLPDVAAHRQAVNTLLTALNEHRNWYLDLANERDVRDERFVPVAELQTLRDEVRRLDPPRLVTASLGGHDLSQNDIRDCLVTVGLDFLCPHRPRTPASPAETEAQTRASLQWAKDLGHPAPILYQEPFRRGYTAWQPKAADFLGDLQGAVAGGAAGWCFHNGQQADTPDHQPRRSFNMSARRLFDQLDPEELQFVAEAEKVLARTKDSAVIRQGIPRVPR
jgi:hypothetical protein